MRYKFDAEKAVEVLLYVAEQAPDMYLALKVLYFADKAHLAQYGRLICGESYVAMAHGPVPSGVYDMVKTVRFGRSCLPEIPLDESFTMDGYHIIPCRSADRDLLSESDMECLDDAIARCQGKTFDQLREMSHDEAYQAADVNDFIPLEAIIAILPQGDLLLSHLQGA